MWTEPIEYMGTYGKQYSMVAKTPVGTMQIRWNIWPHFKPAYEVYLEVRRMKICSSLEEAKEWAWQYLKGLIEELTTFTDPERTQL
jgi:hypothetical protein